MKPTQLAEQPPEHGKDKTGTQQSPEVIDSKELARRWGVPETWVRDYVRTRAHAPIPHVRLGKYVRFEWGSPELEAWFARHRSGIFRATGGR